jgi:membrane protease YdiL (CAAX protease family)
MWEKINRFVHSNVILSVFLISVIFISIVTLLGSLVIDIIPPIRLSIFTIGQIALSVLVVWIMRKMQLFNINDFKFKSIGKGFLIAWAAFAFPIVNFVVTLTQLPENISITPNIFYIIVIVLHPFIGTGFFEEVLYRGLVLKILLKKMGGSKKGIINACVISSVIFGVVHIVNLSVSDILPVMNTIIIAIPIGLFFAALYLRTGTLLFPMLGHALLNLSSQIFDAVIFPDALLQEAQTQTEMDAPSFIMSTLFAAIPYLIAGLILLRKVKPGEMGNEVQTGGQTI